MPDSGERIMWHFCRTLRFKIRGIMMRPVWLGPASNTGNTKTPCHCFTTTDYTFNNQRCLRTKREGPGPGLTGDDLEHRTVRGAVPPGPVPAAGNGGGKRCSRNHRSRRTKGPRNPHDGGCREMVVWFRGGGRKYRWELDNRFT